MMKLIVLDERQEKILKQALRDYQAVGHSCTKEEAYIENALISDIFQELEHNVVTPEDCEKILDAGVEILC